MKSVKEFLEEMSNYYTNKSIEIPPYQVLGLIEDGWVKINWTTIM